MTFTEKIDQKGRPKSDIRVDFPPSTHWCIRLSGHSPLVSSSVLASFLLCCVGEWVGRGAVGR